MGLVSEVGDVVVAAEDVVVVAEDVVVAAEDVVVAAEDAVVAMKGMIGAVAGVWRGRRSVTGTVRVMCTRVRVRVRVRVGMRMGVRSVSETMCLAIGIRMVIKINGIHLLCCI